ncbi:MAG: pimeloyl-ACP methyl ester carboxylesterase [Lentimonas sp.]|jgi:pimeloyl-ACP methyl ester carboxylesterase
MNLIQISIKDRLVTMPPSATPLKQMIANISILTACVLAMAYLGGLLFAYTYADKIIFPYRRAPGISTPDGTIQIRSSLGDRISTLYLQVPNESEIPSPKRILLYSHGNNHDLNELLPIMEQYRAHGLSILAYDYPGYGTSSGTASEASVYAAADAVYHYATETLGYAPEAITLYGCSLGSGPACWLAERYPVGRLILEGAYSSTFRVMTHVKLLPWDKFDNLSRLPAIQCPVLLIHAMQDEVIPFSHALKNLAAIQAPKETLWIESAVHRNVLEIGGKAYWNKILNFTTAPDYIKIVQ